MYITIIVIILRYIIIVRYVQYYHFYFSLYYYYDVIKFKTISSKQFLEFDTYVKINCYANH